MTMLQLEPHFLPNWASKASCSIDPSDFIGISERVNTLQVHERTTYGVTNSLIREREGIENEKR